MSSVVSRWVIKSGALWVAIQLVPGMQASDDPAKVVAAVALFGVLNIALRSVVRLLLFPFLVFAVWVVLAIDALALSFTAALAGWMTLDFVVEGFVPALVGAIVVDVVSVIPNWFVRWMEGQRVIRKAGAWIFELERATSWLEEERGKSQRLAEQRELMIKEQEAWIGQLENATTWLREQRGNWRQLAQERARLIREQRRWIRELERANARPDRQRKDRSPIAARVKQALGM